METTSNIATQGFLTISGIEKCALINFKESNWGKQGVPVAETFDPRPVFYIAPIPTHYVITMTFTNQLINIYEQMTIKTITYT